MTRKVLFAVVAIVCLCSCKTSNNTPENTVQQVMDEYLVGNPLPVVAMVETKEGKKITYSHGFAQGNEGATVSPDHTFQIASMTKLLTSIAALQLVEKGEVTLDEDLLVRYPKWKEYQILTDEEERNEPSQKLSLRQLLTHTSGFGFDMTDKLLDKYNHHNFRRFEGGNRFLYGMSTTKVGEMVEDISGTTLEKYFKRHITGPLEMNETAFSANKNMKDKLVSWYAVERGEIKMTSAKPRVFPSKKNDGSGSMVSTPNDYMKLLVCLLNDGEYEGGRLLSKKWMKELKNPQLSSSISMDMGERHYKRNCCNFKGLIEPEDNWGLATLIKMEDTPNGFRSGTLVWGGSLNTYFFIDEKSKIVGSFWTQLSPFNAEEAMDIYNKFLTTVYQENR